LAKVLKIIWSPRSEQSYNTILDQIELEWSNKEAEAFNTKAMHFIEIIQVHHKIFPISNKANLRKCVITQQTSMIYKINKTTIEIVDFIFNKSEHEF
jgi:hypothetical protein